MYIWSLETMWPLYIYREVIITSANSQQEIPAIASNESGAIHIAYEAPFPNQKLVVFMVWADE